MVTRRPKGEACESRALCTSWGDSLSNAWDPPTAQDQASHSPSITQRLSLAISKTRTLDTGGARTRQLSNTEFSFPRDFGGGRQNQSWSMCVSESQGPEPHLAPLEQQSPSRHGHLTESTVTWPWDGLSKTCGSADQGPAHARCLAPCCLGCERN